MSREKIGAVPAPARPAMVQIPIKRSIDRIPGGMMIVPLFFGAIIRTWAPGVPSFFGSFTGALFTGALTILAVFYVCMGSTIEFTATPYILKKGGALFAAKVGTAVVLGIILGRIWHEAPVEGGILAGLSPLAVGMIIGNLDKEMRDFLGRAVPVMIPFFAFALGAGIDLATVWRAGLLG